MATADDIRSEFERDILRTLQRLRSGRLTVHIPAAAGIVVSSDAGVVFPDGRRDGF